MDAQELNAAHRARPFRPFTLCLADGDKVRVEHPEFLAQAPGGRIAVVTGVDEAFRVVDLRLVTSIEVDRPSQEEGPAGR